ncbi:hypothetical protein KP509_39G028100 [Ceratopteris richardii]|uniref:Uncharacterized protein n=1 Tax=Ceratopteris richardii TaxID=49495 RepID=A0A8T2PZV9_CERRI|nr:hypothetical protein KP509_39G028100 [Ceratopteris richardii]
MPQSATEFPPVTMKDLNKPSSSENGSGILGNKCTEAESESIKKNDTKKGAVLDMEVVEFENTPNEFKQIAKSMAYDGSLDAGGTKDSSVILSASTKARVVKSTVIIAESKPSASDVLPPEPIIGSDSNFVNVSEVTGEKITTATSRDPKETAAHSDHAQFAGNRNPDDSPKEPFVGSSSTTSSLKSVTWSEPCSKVKQENDEQYVQPSFESLDSERTSVMHIGLPFLEQMDPSLLEQNNIKLDFSSKSSISDVNVQEVSAEQELGAKISGVSVNQNSSVFNDSSSSSSRERCSLSLEPCPVHQKINISFPNTSLDLPSLIDSAIQGSDFSSLEKLKRVVAEDSCEKQVCSLRYASRTVVDILLTKMGIPPEGQCGGNDSSSSTIMLSAGAARVAGELIPWISSRETQENVVNLKVKLLKGLGSSLKACTRNRSMCSDVGLLQVLIGVTETMISKSYNNVNPDPHDDWSIGALFNLLTLLGSHKLTVEDLRRWLKVTADSVPQGRSLDFLLSLEQAVLEEETKGPSHTFEFDGESSGLLGPSESRWPFINGYAFATWIYIESFADTMHTAATAAAIAAAAIAKAGKFSAISAAAAASALAEEGTAHMPRLFSFLSSDNQGVEAYFHGQFLIVESTISRNKKASSYFTFNFKPHKWYFVGLEHSYQQGLLGKTESEVKLYVDGHLCESRPLEFPRLSKPLAFCCIGTNPPTAMAGLQRCRRECPLFAEMGPVYIFKEPIGEDKMCRLAERGGDYVPKFGLAAGLPSYSTNDLMMDASEDSATLDMELESSLHLLYHPKLLMGRSCPDTSPIRIVGNHRRSAEILGQVRVAARVRPVEALWAMGEGGALSLLSLAFGTTDITTMEPLVQDPSISAKAAVLAAPILRIIALSLQHPGNIQELLKRHTPQMLACLLEHILCTPDMSKHYCMVQGQDAYDARNEEIVAAIIFLTQTSSINQKLKVQLYRKLLLDIKLWAYCSYGLQKKILSSLADMVLSESTTMRSANALQMLLDGCRKCYWMVPESDSLKIFAGRELPRPVGELNALIDELLVIIELLLGTSEEGVSNTDVQALIMFLLDCPQPNQVARVLHLLYRLIVQPNTSRASIFAEDFIRFGGFEMLLTLLQRECEAGETPPYMQYLEREVDLGSNHMEAFQNQVHELASEVQENNMMSQIEGANRVANQYSSTRVDSKDNAGDTQVPESVSGSESIVAHVIQVHEDSLISESSDLGPRVAGILTNRNIGGIGLSITADTVKNNFRNIDTGDGIVVGIIGLLGALISGGYLRLSATPSRLWSSNTSLSPIAFEIPEHKASENFDISVWLLYALQKALESAPKRLLTDSVYEALLAAVIRSQACSSPDGQLNLYESFHSFDHTQLLAVLLRALPYGPRLLQIRALQDILFLACTHPDNRIVLTTMPEWPEWLLEILIYNYEVGASKMIEVDGSFGEIEDLVFNFLMIMLEHSLRQRNGWKDVEAIIHCAEWLAMIGGSSAGEQRQRREESLPVIKRKLLGGLLEFAARELPLQTQVVAAAAANVVAGGLSPRTAKAEADAAAFLSMSLVENAIVLLMLVEDHLRLQCQIFNPSLGSVPSSVGASSPSTFTSSGSFSLSNRSYSDTADGKGYHRSSSEVDSRGISIDVLASMADSNGQISAAAMERLTAAAAAEPYESVRCAFVSYGTCSLDLAAGWKRRSHMWYGVGLPPRGVLFGGGGSGWDSWMSIIEKDEHGDWIELSLVEKSIMMLQALLMDASNITARNVSYGFGGGAMTGAGGMHVVHQFLDSDQPFFTMLRMVLVSMREEDKGVDKPLPSFGRGGNDSETDLTRLSHVESWNSVTEYLQYMATKRTKDSLLWCVLAPLLTMPLSESRRQRVLVCACIMYSEVWHAVSADKKALRKHYLGKIIPPFTTLLRRWRPLLYGIYELTDAEGQSPLTLEDGALAIDARPLEAVAAMVTPEWASAFASPPAAMVLAAAAAGAGGGESNTSEGNQQRRESLAFERNSSRTQSFITHGKTLESTSTLATPDDRGGEKNSTIGAYGKESIVSIGPGRGLGTIAMASSAQRRTSSDRDRAKRWGIFESMNIAWLQSVRISKSSYDYSEKDGDPSCLKLIESLFKMAETSRLSQHAETQRRRVIVEAYESDKVKGLNTWCSLLRRLYETQALFVPISFKAFKGERIFWKLDSTENAMRMRRRLKQNYRGTDHSGAANDYLSLGTINNSPSKMINDKGLTTGTPLPSTESGMLSPEQLMFEDIGDDDNCQNHPEESEERREDCDHLSASSKQSSFDNHPNLGMNVEPCISLGSISRIVRMGLMDPQDTLLLEIPAIMIRPLRVSKGMFQVTYRHILFTVDQDGCRNPSEHKGIQMNDEREGNIWPLSALSEVYSRRYLLRRSALELFMVDRSNFFFNFETTDGRRKAYKALVQADPPRLRNVYTGTQRPDQLFKRTKLMEQWARWEISNFEYLMQLNTLSGRSYNDITQYPVFPWILADYTSQNLELDNPKVYRDLSKPVGALNPNRLEKFLEEYNNFDDTVIPPFHYGSHYSSASTVLYYLMRIEPFTTLSKQLHGGKFDHADHMFSDIGANWNGVLEDISDVKELVPELFYSPEVLMNINNINFGRTQRGNQLGDVQLPPWANCPVDFIRKHRAALESPYVSANLHNWIDLIFGYKQKGSEAVIANNVFFYTTYEGSVDVDNIKDPTIFRNPSSIHRYAVPFSERCNLPACAISVTNDSIIVVDGNAPTCSVATHKWQPHTPDGHGLPFHFEHCKPIVQPGGGGLARIFNRQASSRVAEWQYPRAVALPASGIKSNNVIAILADRHLLTGGHADDSLKLVSCENAQTIESATGHSAPVSCVSLSPDGNICLTGSYDCTAMIWQINSTPAAEGSLSTDRTETGSMVGSENPVANIDKYNLHVSGERKRYIEGPLSVLRGHVEKLTCCCVNVDLDIAVSCSQTRGVLMHSITKGRLIRSLPLIGVDLIDLSPEGILVIWHKTKRCLSTMSINGILIASVGLSSSDGDITSMAISRDGQCIVAGTSCMAHDFPNTDSHVNSSSQVSDGKSSKALSAKACQMEGVSNASSDEPLLFPAIILLDIYTLEILHRFNLNPGQNVTALALSKDCTNLLVSTSDKQLFIYTDPTLSIKVLDRMLRLGWQGAGLAVNVGSSAGK